MFASILFPKASPGNASTKAFGFISCRWEDVVPGGNPRPRKVYDFRSNMEATHDVIRINYDGGTFATYFNGELVATEEFGSVAFDKVAMKTNKFDAWVTLVALDDMERRKGKGLAEAMQYGPKSMEARYFELEKLIANDIGGKGKSAQTTRN